MEVKTKEDWLYQFRRCSSRETLEKVISHTRYKLTPAELDEPPRVSWRVFYL
ncbi:Hha/YmoA family nucleoid-associated regulatory protein [Escherichia coli]